MNDPRFPPHRLYGSSLRDIPQAHVAEAPAVRALDRVHARAEDQRCSDIHFEPQPGGMRVRFRIDGIMHDATEFTGGLAQAIVSRIKVLAGIDIADRRTPQDGRYTIALANRHIDVRVSSIPTLAGEAIVLRLFERGERPVPIAELGMSQAIEYGFTRAVQLAHGFVVACGPTGSGKTTSLYAALTNINTDALRVCTIEDPVERLLERVTQVQVHARAGLTFESALRALFRQDPDVIMVGEMRDLQTASTAISAALSGRLVLTSLHSKDAPRSIERLAELGVMRSSIAAGLSAILGQRLVRVLCAHCRRATSISAETARDLNVGSERVYFEPAGCERCNRIGYRGRTGIFELVIIDESMRDAIEAGSPSTVVAALAAQRGYRSMYEHCVDKCYDGITSLAELRRVARGSAA